LGLTNPIGGLHDMEPPDLASRARGVLLGLAAGNALGVPVEFLATAERIASEYPAGLSEVVRRDRPESPYDDDLALALILGEWLADGELDLQRLAMRWVEWMRRDGRGIGVWTAKALEHIAIHGSPPASTGGQAGNGAVSRCLPVALATRGSPRNLVGGTYHTAALTHPDERCTWSAVAVNVTAACLLQGRRDFIPDVLEALRNNAAPDEVIAAVRRVPLEKRTDLKVAGPEAGYTVHCMEIALWCAYHEPNLERGLIWLVNAGGDTDTNAAVAGGLMGARDGAAAVPARWLASIPGTERISRLADRLVGFDG
jgi:ADP-ribosyl-[dinitrogen reductase] hydrolase